MSRADQPEPRCSAFTLVELMVVIGVVALLAALMLPALSGSRTKAQRIQCVNNEHQLGLALQTFLADNRCYPVGMGAPTNSDPPGRWWGDQLERGGLGVGNPAPGFMLRGVWRCPSAKPPPEIARGGIWSYGYNMFGSAKVGVWRTNELGLLGNHGDLDALAPVREAEVIHPADMIAIGEASGLTFMRALLYDFPRRCLRHGSKLNVLFCDGHVESPKVQSLFEDATNAALVRWNRDHQPHRESL